MRPVKIILTAMFMLLGLSFVCFQGFYFRPSPQHKVSLLKSPPATVPSRNQMPVSEPDPVQPLAEPLKRRLENSSVAVSAPTNSNLNKAASSKRKLKEPLRDPVARAALSLVGLDSDAEMYWLGAIYDTSLSDQEREDLMEDLNEEGLSDPKHPGPEDLPLIWSRLALLEEIAPHADEFMLPHLAEAYKDLANLLAGQPPQ